MYFLSMTDLLSALIFNYSCSQINTHPFQPVQSIKHPCLAWIKFNIPKCILHWL